MSVVLSAAQLERYRSDGVVHVPGAIDSQWRERLLAVVDERLQAPGKWVNDGNPGAPSNRMFTERYLWREHPVINDFVLHSSCASLAAQAMGLPSVRFYFDHLLVKEPGTPAATPWHQDVPYWPFMGSQICSVWVALTDVSVAESAMEFVRGSHRDGRYYQPEVFNAREDHPNAWTEQAQGEPMPDIEGNRGEFDIIGFDMRAGDAVVFSAWLLHGAPGNQSAVARRAAISTRWLGADARWCPKPGCDPTVDPERVRVSPGDYPADDDLFPVVGGA